MKKIYNLTFKNMTEVEYIKEIFKKNWFTYDKSINCWIRDDWTCISKEEKRFVIAFWWLKLEEYCDNRFELIWKLAFYNIINRLW